MSSVVLTTTDADMSTMPGVRRVDKGWRGERSRVETDEGERLLLHAERLSFVHPATGEPMTVERPAPF